MTIKGEVKAHSIVCMKGILDDVTHIITRIEWRDTI